VVVIVSDIGKRNSKMADQEAQPEAVRKTGTSLFSIMFPALIHGANVLRPGTV
jgi:hypothetical protein